MSTVLSNEAFHQSVGFAFGELLVLEQISQLPAESILRVLQSIPEPLLQHALAGRNAAAQPVADLSGERRHSPRRKVLRGGQVIHDGGRSILEVQVRDISGGGCRIWSRNPSSVPDHFTIRIVGVYGERPCEVRWRSGEELGVEFLPNP